MGLIRGQQGRDVGKWTAAMFRSKWRSHGDDRDTWTTSARLRDDRGRQLQECSCSAKIGGHNDPEKEKRRAGVVLRMSQAKSVLHINSLP